MLGEDANIKFGAKRVPKGPLWQRYLAGRFFVGLAIGWMVLGITLSFDLFGLKERLLAETAAPAALPLLLIAFGLGFGIASLLIAVARARKSPPPESDDRP